MAAGLVLASIGSARATSDPFWNQQYGPKQIFAAEAWTKSRGSGVKIAIIDSGVDLDHPDIKPRLVANCPGSGCRDVAENDDNPDDDSTATYEGPSGDQVPVKGHGTMVAGVAAAATDNGIGIAAIAPDAQLMPVKVFGDENSLTLTSDVPEAVDFALDKGAKVLNLSIADLGIAALVGTIQSACNNAFARGALCVVATGNDGTEPSGYSASFNAILVTANDAQGKHASFAQKADTKWGLSAPGVDVVSTHPTDMHTYAKATGTSIAAPHVSGVAALLFAQGLSNQAVVDRLRSTATSMGDTGTNGSGLVNAAAAVGAPVGGSGSGGGGSTATGGGSKGSTATGSGSAGGGPVTGGEMTTTSAAPTDSTIAEEEVEPGPALPLEVGIGDLEADSDEDDGLLAAMAALLLLGVGAATGLRLRALSAVRAPAR